MSDIVTRLLLKTNDFDANLAKSKTSVNNFQGGISNMAKSVSSGFMKVAGAVGVAGTAIGTFSKIMGSQQSTQDEWDNNLFAAKMTVDKFFTSINNGDWTSFQNGFIQSLIQAKNLSAEIDALNDKRLSLTYIKSEALAKIEEKKAAATDTTLPKSERQAAFKEMQKEREELARKTNETIKKETDVLINTLNVQYGNLNWTEDDVITFVVDTNFTGGSAEFLRYKEQLEELKSKEKVNTYNAGGVSGGSYTTTIDKVAAERTRQFKLQNQALEKQRILEQEIDKKREKTVNLLRQQAGERRELSSLEKAENRINRQINGDGKNSKEKPKEGSIAWYDSEISELNKKLIAETDVQAKSAIQATISELEAKKIKLQIESSNGSIEAINIQLADLNKKYISASTDEARKEIYKLVQELESKKLHINLSAKFDENKAPLKMAGLPTDKFNTKNLKLPKHDPLFKKEDIDLNQEYAESLANISGVVGSMSGLFDDNTASVLQWGVSFLSTVGQAIPKILEMASANEVEAATAQKSAIANTAAASGEVLKAHAGIPFVGIALGLAGVAAIIAAMSSMPKYATGGIVPGTSFTGDKVPALLNSGEMILNGSQQSNLFRMLNSGLYGSLSQKITPSGNGDIRLYSDVEIKGDRIFLALHNHIKKTGKRLW